MAVDNARSRCTLFHIYILAIFGWILLCGFALFAQDKDSRKTSQTKPAGSSGATSPTAKASAAIETASSPPIGAEARPHSSTKSNSALGAINASQKARLINAFGNFPMRYEANQGQTDEHVEFLSRGQGYTLFLTGEEAVLSLREPSESSRQSAVGSRQTTAGGNSKLETGRSKNENRKTLANP